MNIKLTKPTFSNNNLCITNLTTYSITHALVDASCAAIISSNIALKNMSLQQLSFYVILYNILAFALQAPIGFIVDTIKKPSQASCFGCFLVIIGLITYKATAFALIIAGIGNALFHVGGGITALNLRAGKASLPGIFVAPGAIGLLIGTLAGKTKFFSPLPFIILLLISIIIILFIKKPILNYDNNETENISNLIIILICVLVSIALRGMLGFMLTYSWKSNINLLVLFTISVSLGKAFGGILGDQIGWTRVAVSGLLISAPLLVLGMNLPALAILGVFFFNLTMPVTLAVIAKLIPGKPGYAFGLTTLALIIGAFPTFTSLNSILCKNNNYLILASVLLMAFTLKLSLNKLFSNKNI